MSELLSPSSEAGSLVMTVEITMALSGTNDDEEEQLFSSEHQRWQKEQLSSFGPKNVYHGQDVRHFGGS